MSKIHIVRQHTLSLESARAEVERIAERVDQELGADYAWEGDTLVFSRSGVSGQITVTEHALDLEIRLGLLLSAMKGQIAHRIEAKVDETLARHGAAVPADSPEERER
jgi:putative polyhydroxyalkanoate system protein